MIEILQLNMIKVGEWDVDPRCGSVMSGLILMSLQNGTLIEKSENLFYKTSMKKILKELPSLKPASKIMKYLKILESNGLIKLDVEKFSINYMFTEKGSTWLVYDLAHGRKLEAMYHEQS